MELLSFEEFLDNVNEMANLSPSYTGLPNGVFIWCGEAPPEHGHRIKICNKPNRFDNFDAFTLTIPDFAIIGNVNTKLIDKKVMNNIHEFVNLNAGLIKAYSSNKIKTKTFLMLLKPVPKIRKKNENRLLEFYDSEKKFNTTISTLTDIERYDSNMIDVHFESSGIDVILYIGENPHSKIHRIKVSNINLLSNKSDLFTIFLPNFDTLGDVKIDDSKLSNIFKFIKLNMEIIKHYSDNKIDTGTFINGLKSINV